MILSIPGWQNSPPGHWQTLWEATLPGPVQRIEMDDWHSVHREDWVQALHRAIESASQPVVLLAHSLGALTVAHWAAAYPTHAARVRGAFLVNPPDIDTPGRCPECLQSFAPMPQQPLPFPSLFVGSQSDPYAAPSRLREMAHAWKAGYHCAGDVGHINLASGHGPWPQGEELFAEFLASLP